MNIMSSSNRTSYRLQIKGNLNWMASCFHQYDIGCLSFFFLLYVCAVNRVTFYIGTIHLHTPYSQPIFLNCQKKWTYNNGCLAIFMIMQAFELQIRQTHPIYSTIQLDYKNRSHSLLQRFALVQFHEYQIRENPTHLQPSDVVLSTRCMFEWNRAFSRCLCVEES